jgi:uncharacterized repeat protein (TIGR01451 family)
MKWNYQIAPSRIKLFGGLALAAALSFSQSVWALGTASGTTVTNQATLNFSVGGVGQPAALSDGDTLTAGVQTTDFKVDNKVNLTVVTVDAAAVAVVPGQSTAGSAGPPVIPAQPIVATFTVTNNGNTVQDYSLAAANLTSIAANNVFPFAGAVNDTIDTGACSVFVESLAVPNGYTPGVDVATFIDELAADATKTVYVVCASIPGTAVNGDQANVSLTATTVGGGAAGIGAAILETANTQAGVEIVFADPATTVNVSGTDPGQTARNKIGVANDAFKVVSATLAVTKTVTPICDPFNGNVSQKNIPGAAVQYAITIANTGATAATLTSVTDSLAAQLAFDPKLNSGVLPATNCVSGNVTNTLSASGFGAKTGVGTGPGVTAPGAAADATTAGAVKSGIVGAEIVTITFNALATSAITAPAAATLAAGSYITVYFNAFVQ